MKYILAALLIICLVVSIVVICAQVIPNAGGSDYKITVTGPSGTVYPYNDMIKVYWMQENADIHSYYMTGTAASGDASFKPVYITWDDADASFVTKYVVEYATKADYSDAITVVKDTRLNYKTIDVYNLYKGSTYHVRVTAYAADTVLGQAEASFQTSELGPRIMKIDGLYNVRDLGGYTTADGKTTRQGMIYRGSEMDGDNGIALSEEGNTYMSNVLGIQTDLDLRGNTQRSPISSASKLSFGIGGYLAAFSQTELYRGVFSALANENNYPVYMHCVGGADRTGTVCYLLNALLGVQEEDLIRDYELTSYSIFGDRARDHAAYDFAPFVEKLKAYEGDTLAEKTENYMLSIGVTESEIDSIRAIMLG